MIRSVVLGARGRRGVVTPLVALCLVLVMAIAAIALDGGLLLLDRRRAQSVADAAALAGAADLYTHFPTNQGVDTGGTAKSAAQASAAANGYSNDGVSSVVTVNIPPTSGTHSGVAGYVEVIVQLNQARGFSSVLGTGSLAVTARSVARGLQTAYSPAGILLLDPSATGAFNDPGSGITTSGGAPIIINSSSSTAMTVGGNGNVSASQINITGNYTTTGNGTVTGTVSTGQAATPDPLAKIPAPDPSTLTTQSNSLLSISQGSTTLQPGVYNGGIAVSASASVTLQPGVYYLNGGGLNLSGQATLIGSGVTIYNNPSDNTDQVQIAGGCTVNLSAPTSGQYMGITIFQNRTSTTPLNLSGNGSSTITGTIYAYSARLTVSGNSTATLGSQYITDALTVTGTGTFTLPYNPGKVARIHDIRLTE